MSGKEYGHEEEIHARGTEASAGKPLHAAGDGRQHRDVFRTVSAVLNGFAEEFHHP